MMTYRVTDYGVLTDSPALQTKALQAVLDRCQASGGRVVLPRGRYYTGSLRMWSDTTLYLEAGAELYGSDDCEDYEVYPIPAGVEMRSDMELITAYYGKAWDTYRRAILTAYGCKNISIIGEAGSVIDGQNCYDGNGEEGYRGPHAIFLTCCENVLFEGYTARHSGNFLHEANNCRHLVMRRVTCLGGSDGIHLHCSEDTLIEDCLFRTGDDCIAGININGLTVKNCILNTSCNLFRMGGVGILVENCYAFGPGYYPHRVTVVKGKGDELPREEGRHNSLNLVEYFASGNYPFTPSEITFRNCSFDSICKVFYYRADSSPLQCGTYWGSLTLENVSFRDLYGGAAVPIAKPDHPFTVHLRNVSVSFREGVAVPDLIAPNEHSFTTVTTDRYVVLKG